MKSRNSYRKYGPRLAPLYSVTEEGDEGAGGGGGGNEGGEPSVAEQVAAAVAEATSGLKNKNTELLNSLKERTNALKAWEGLEPEKVRGFMEKLGQDEELSLIAEGRHEDAWAKRRERIDAEHTTALQGMTSRLDETTAALETTESTIKNLVIDQQVLTSFHSEKGLDTASADVVARAKQAFVIEDGIPVARDGNGNLITGANGAITVPEWVAELKVTAPHLFPGSVGAGTGGSGPGGGAGGDFSSRLAKAAAAGDMDLYKEIKKEQKAQSR